MENQLKTLTTSQQQFVNDAFKRFGRTILTHKDVLVNAKKIGQDFSKLLLETVKNLD